MNRMAKSWSRSLSTSLLCLGLATTVAAIGWAAVLPAIAQDAYIRTLTVTGRGSEVTAATLANVELGVEVQGATATAVQQQVAAQATAVVNVLRSRGVDQLQTTGIRLNPQYNYENGRTDLVGYIGTNTVSFQVPADQSGELLDDAVEAGATQIQNIQFVANDTAIAAAQQVALRAATDDAQRQANTVLSHLNLGATEIVSIQINGASAPVPMPLPVEARMMAADASFSTPVVSGEQRVEATVTLQIRY